MIAEELINQVIPALRCTDTVGEALENLNEYRVNELPVVHDKEYLGLVSDAMLQEAPGKDVMLSEIPLSHQNAYVHSSQHLYDIIRVAHENNIDTIPILKDEDNTYAGSVTVRETVKALSKSMITNTHGGILVLAMRYIDYSLAEISRLAESNGVKILSAITEPDEKDPEWVKVTLKFNTNELRSVIATFERYNYRIIARFMDTNSYHLESERLGMLFRYLEL
ncbi:MAG: CBS domain-containing protein [Cytophagales bacterium]|nr:CBS domain-containing protein [Cytophagales bacterium]MDW8383383.1 CBS domain-containing protein [Flammeovirgaceae bacterium]